jgi:uncharacterized membrane protein
MSRAHSSGGRLAFIDWTRGLAAIIMLQGHVFHSFTKPEQQSSTIYTLSQFVGGMPPAVFLFLTGMTLAFLMESQARRGVNLLGRVVASLKRARYLLAIAFLFRIQLWLTGLPQTQWRDLFRVDILNCMGLAVALLSVLVVCSTVQRAYLGFFVGCMIAGMAPVVSQWDWSAVPSILRSYFAPDYQFFAFFPWAAFVGFGISAGSIVRLLGRDQLERAVQHAAILGFALILGGQYCANLPFSIYPKADFWLNSPVLIAIKLGVILLMLAWAYLWTEYGASREWSWVRQFGTTSLLVYWVHTELVYGRWLYFWKGSLSVAQACIAAVAVVLLMLALSVIRTNWRNWRYVRLSFVYPFCEFDTAAGD